MNCDFTFCEDSHFKATIFEVTSPVEEGPATEKRIEDSLQIEVNLYAQEIEEKKIWVHFRKISGSIHEFLDFYEKISKRLGLPKPSANEEEWDYHYS